MLSDKNGMAVFFISVNAIIKSLKYSTSLLSSKMLLTVDDFPLTVIPVSLVEVCVAGRRQQQYQFEFDGINQPNAYALVIDM